MQLEFVQVAASVNLFLAGDARASLEMVTAHKTIDYNRAVLSSNSLGCGEGLLK